MAKGDTNKINIQPLFDNVLVKPLDADTKTASGILLPDTVKEKPTKGKVMAVGTGGHDEKGNKIEFAVKVGDTVYYKKWGGNEIKINGEEWQILEQKDILAIISE
jgi:chaperonin GroES